MIKRIIKPTPKFSNQKEIILRDFLALERTRLANERTLITYIKAALYLLIGGITLIHIKDFENIKWIGYISLVMSVLFVIRGFIRFFHLKHRLKQFYDNNNLSESN